MINETSEQLIKSLTDNFLASIVQAVQDQALAAIEEKLKNLDVTQLVQDTITEKIIPEISETIKNQVNSGVQIQLTQTNVLDVITSNINDTLIPRVEKLAFDRLNSELLYRASTTDFNDLAIKQISASVQDLVKNFNFPDWSIPGRAIQADSLKISAYNVEGGLIRNFESTGIQDRASGCQVTILDQGTVFENRLFAAGLEITGDAAIKGTLSLEGNIDRASSGVKDLVDLVIEKFDEKYDQGTYDQYVNRVFDQLTTDGVDSTIIKHNDQILAVDGTLAGNITKSNLQKVGALKELQVIGETLLDETIYVSGGRVGINTIEPEHTFEIWDQEVQLVAGKRQQDTAMFGTTRAQNLILTANGKDQLTLNSDGSVTIKNINIGHTSHSSAPRMPTDNRPIGHVVWNENPIIGASVGWVSLGGARWAAFGTITG